MKLGRIIFAAGLTAAGVLVTASPAAATIGTCTITPVGARSVSVYCQGTPPTTFKALIICDGSFPKYGPLRNAGGGVASVASCPLDALPTDDGVVVYNP
jgi:hypothetical protein